MAARKAKEAKKGTWGGKRPGAGRPALNRDLVRLTLDVERDVGEALRQLAEERGVTRTDLVREALERLVKRQKGQK